MTWSRAVIEVVYLSDYEMLGELILEKALLIFLIKSQSTSINIDDLINIEKDIIKLNNRGIFDRRVSERRDKAIDGSNSGKRRKARRVSDRLISS
ncbi:MAG: hypothetical protein KAI44_02995 [Methylococcales bacterium]|nr:hypothetical protein [Methylococcales bacterium]MCK5477861.1 hypothetical protein [Methylococcales bacterium]